MFIILLYIIYRVSFSEYSRVEEQLVLATDQLRCALDSISRITGRVGIEDILDIVFSDFCIGK